MTAHFDHSIATAIWRLDGQADNLLDTYHREIAAKGLQTEKMVPALRFSTSDVGMSGANLYPIFLVGAESRIVPLGYSIRTEHKNGVDMQYFEEQLRLVYAQFEKALDKQVQLMNIEIRYPVTIYKAAFPANEVLLAAPTGRASRRMAEQTGMHASTLHSALGLVTDEDSPLNDKELLSADLVVVDEFSMVDMRLAYILLDRIKSGAQLIIVGDADQLPSVGAGNVLREMIRSEKVPTAVLETVFRQASNSRIITNAYAINHNDTHLQFGDDFQFLEVQNSEEAAQLVIKNYLREVSLHGIEDVQILSPLRKRGAVAANALNETIRDLVNPPNNLKKEVKCGSRVFRVGDRIMQTANRINVSNGDVGVITDMKKEDDETITCVRLLDGRTLQYTQEMLEDLEFSYCTTIHKSQGQEYPVIIVPLLKEHYIMLRRNLLYTAVTRAKAKVILIGQKQAVFVAIHKCDVGQRNTVLADRIVAYYNRELSRRVA